MSASLTHRQTTRLLLVAAVLFVGAGLTEFLPYFSVEYEQDRYRYTGAQLLAGSYHDAPSWVAPNASDGTVAAVLVLVASLLGLATSWSRRHRLLAWGLGISTVIVALGGCLSTFEIDPILGGVQEQVEFGFWLALPVLAAAAVIRVILWRQPIAAGRASV